jgi:hypothetical protein
MRFEQNEQVRLETHIRKLMAAPGSPTIQAYPEDLVAPSDAAVALERAHRPVVILFYDDRSKASDLQAADFIPVLRRFGTQIDVVPIDVTAADSWDDAERKLVRTYYMATVPTTVVLSADRRPLLLKFQRIDGAALEAKLEVAVSR